MGTWTWGCQFSSEGRLEIHSCLGEKPFHGAYPHRWACAPIRTDWPQRDVWNELKRGWRRADAPFLGSVPGEPGLVLLRDQPGGSGVTLGLIHRGVDFRRPGMEGVHLEYFLQEGSNQITPLPEIAWADWDAKGRLLVATTAGVLEVRDLRGSGPIWSVDLNGLNPDPQPAPEWAGRW